MKTGMTQSEVEQTILEYLLTNPDAKDDLEGIAGWWLVKQSISTSVNIITNSIDDLVEKGCLCASQVGKTKIIYTINHEKIDEIKKIIQQN